MKHIEIDIMFGEGDRYYVTCDLSGTVRIHNSEPKFYSIFNKITQLPPITINNHKSTIVNRKSQCIHRHTINRTILKK